MGPSHRKSSSATLEVVAESQKGKSSESPHWALQRSSISGGRCVCTRSCVAYRCLHSSSDPTAHKHDRKQCPEVAWCRSWVIKMRQPWSSNCSGISYSRRSGDVSEWKRRQWSTIERRPQPRDPTEGCESKGCLCNFGIYARKRFGLGEVDGTAAVATEGVDKWAATFSLIPIFRGKLDLWRENCVDSSKDV